MRDVQLFPVTQPRAGLQPVQPDHPVCLTPLDHHHLLLAHTLGDLQKDEAMQR